ncbi:glutamate decarboxylase 1-like, partial [Trifolium medium]|nr:glutamate decarboxylase 1-like [Trifolium medium]
AERLALDIKNVLHELQKLPLNIKDEKSFVDTALEANREIIAQESNKRQKIMAT